MAPDTPDVPRRLLLKLSGEALAPPGGGIDAAILARTAQSLRPIVARRIELAVVVGGGNLLRGSQFQAGGNDRITGDHMGTLATIMNALALRDALAREGLPASVLSSVAIAGIVPGYSRDEAVRQLAHGQVVVLAGGSGNPLFTTDTAATLRAIEIRADLLVKATGVDGVYTADPKRDPDARLLDRVSYDAVLAQGLAVMDATAVCLAREHGLPIRVMNIHREGALEDIARGRFSGTLMDLSGGGDGTAAHLPGTR